MVVDGEPPFFPRTTGVRGETGKLPPKGRGWNKPPNALVFLGRLAPRNPGLWNYNKLWFQDQLTSTKYKCIINKNHIEKYN
jgi:hypothetical protein